MQGMIAMSSAEPHTSFARGGMRMISKKKIYPVWRHLGRGPNRWAKVTRGLRRRYRYAMESETGIGLLVQ